MSDKTNISIAELLERAIIDGLVEVKENELTRYAEELVEK